MTNLYDQLSKAHVTQVIVEYSGAGDEGMIDDVIFSYEEGHTPEGENQELAIEVETFVYEQLATERGGWEINDGSHGKVTIDVASRKAHFDHYEHEIISKLDPFEVR